MLLARQPSNPAYFNFVGDNADMWEFIKYIR